MLFNSYIFVLLFFPLVVLGYYWLHHMKQEKMALGYLTMMSMVFYGYNSIQYLGMLIVSILVNYLLACLMDRTGRLMLRKLFLALGLLYNLGILFCFKYYDFFIENLNTVLHADYHFLRLALPLGISFYTFQQISYVVDSYRGDCEKYSLLEYAAYVSFFPQLIAGPIVYHDELIPRLRAEENHHIQYENLCKGIYAFALGMAKKVLVADTLSKVVTVGYADVNLLNNVSTMLVMVCYSLQIYFDFSGYCDMARGIGRMFGFRLPENFNSPFKASSVREFWRRWHMTLSRFLSQYIYFPLGGSRKGKARQCLNLLAVFLVSGIWHGANWTFVVWGLMHGLAAVFETAFPKLRFRWEWMNRLATAVFVTLSFSVFRSDSLEMAGLLWRKLFAEPGGAMLAGICNTLVYPENRVFIKFLEMKAPELLNGFFLVCFALLSGVSLLLLQGRKAEEWIEKRGHTLLGAFCLATLFVWSFLSLSQVSVFLYFNF